MDAGSAPTIADFEPVTFAERGVAVPFTTPNLCQARLRPVSKGIPEVMIHNPSGGKGFYVVGWKGVAGLFALTLHDQLLIEALGLLREITPDRVRQVALRIASTGAGGEGAAAIAAKAAEADRDAASLTQLVIITELLRAAGAGDITLTQVVTGDDGVETRVKGIIRAFAPKAGLDPEAIFQVVEQIADVLGPTGLKQSPVPGRLRMLAGDLETMREEIKAFLGHCMGGDRQVGEFVLAALEVTLTAFQTLLVQVDKDVTDIVRLIRAWRTHSAPLGERLSRCSWILDGWDHLRALWLAAGTEEYFERRQALYEMALYVPAIPREMTDWTAGAQSARAAVQVQRKWVKVNEDWRTTLSAAEVIQRNERLKAEYR